MTSGKRIFWAVGWLNAWALVTVLCLLVHAVLSACGFGGAADGQREVRISVPESLEYEGMFDDLMKESFVSYRLVRVRTVDMGAAYQLIYQGELRESGEVKRFLDAVRERNGNLPVSLGSVPDNSKDM